MMPIDFYKTFLVDFFILKQATYKNIIDNLDGLEPLVLKDVSDYSRDEYVNVLRSSIRVTYFHSIETLFELIFALESGINEKVDWHQDELILHKLSSSNYRSNFERITKFANSDTSELAKWSKNHSFIPTNESERISLLQYIFYYTLSKSNTDISDKHWELLPSSLRAIEESLITLAKDFSNRSEYNSYKHGLRVVQSNKKLAILDPDTNTQILNFDFTNSMTYLLNDKDALRVITKNFDTVRDFNMTFAVSELISNIINIRKAVYFKTPLTVKFFDPEILRGLNKMNVKNNEIIVTYKY